MHPASASAASMFVLSPGLPPCYAPMRKGANCVRKALFLVLLLALVLPRIGRSATITSVAGNPGAGSALDVAQRPWAIAVQGTFIYVTDTTYGVVRRVDLMSGDEIVVAGIGGGVFGGDDAPATGAQLNFPMGIAIDAGGNVLIADSDNSRIRRVDASTGIITTVAGTNAWGFGGDGGPATAARLNSPADIALDAAGNLVIADGLNERIRRVDAVTGIITTIVGTGATGFGGDGGPAAAAVLDDPASIAFDAAGDLFIADGSNQRIRRVDATTGIITTVAGNGVAGFGGDGGPATSAQLNGPSGVAVDPDGNVLIADQQNFRIRRVDAATGVISTVVGNGSYGYSGDGGLATDAGLNYAPRVAFDAVGDLLVAENDRIRRVDGASGIISTIAGNGSYGYSGDGGLATAAQIGTPPSVALNSAGDLFIADSGDSRIRRMIAATGVITTIAGNGTYGYSGDGGPAIDAQLQDPQAIAVDAAGNLFISEHVGGHVRRVDAATGVVTTVAGNGTFGYAGDGGPATLASLSYPLGIGFDGAGGLFIADTNSNRIRRVDPATGIITTIAGNGIPAFGGDGGPATAANLNYPVAVAADAAGDLFIADYVNFRVRRVDVATGVITTVAGGGTSATDADGGLAVDAHIIANGLALDADGNLFISDNNTRVRRVDAVTNIISTVAGGSLGFGGDGGPATAASLFGPTGLGFDSWGNLFIADTGNIRVRRVAAPVACGDHVTETDEQCDDGAANGTASSCCTDACGFAVSGHVCTEGRCDGMGSCVSPGTTSTTTVSTSSSSIPSTTTTSLFACSPTPESTCQSAAPHIAKLRLRRGRLTWDWRNIATLTTNDFGSPSTDTAYLLCLYDASGMKMSAQVAPGLTCGRRPCWKPLGAYGFKYRDRIGASDGVTKILLEAGEAGRARIEINGGGRSLHLPQLPLNTPVRVQVRQSSTSLCWGATYTTAIRNTVSEFTAKSD